MGAQRGDCVPSDNKGSLGAATRSCDRLTVAANDQIVSCMVRRCRRPSTAAARVRRRTSQTAGQFLPFV